MAANSTSKVYGFPGLLWRLLLAGGIVFALSAGGSYVLAERLIRRTEASAPNLLTLSVEEALERASSEGFSLIVDRREGTNLLEEGHILGQRPNPGMSVKQGSTIRVTVATRP